LLPTSRGHNSSLPSSNCPSIYGVPLEIAGACDRPFSGVFANLISEWGLLRANTTAERSITGTSDLQLYSIIDGQLDEGSDESCVKGSLCRPAHGRKKYHNFSLTRIMQMHFVLLKSLIEPSPPNGCENRSKMFASSSIST
jgi:hypothetical protein